MLCSVFIPSRQSFCFFCFCFCFCFSFSFGFLFCACAVYFVLLDRVPSHHLHSTVKADKRKKIELSLIRLSCQRCIDEVCTHFRDLQQAPASANAYILQTSPPKLSTHTPSLICQQHLILPCYCVMPAVVRSSNNPASLVRRQCPRSRRVVLATIARRVETDLGLIMH